MTTLFASDFGALADVLLALLLVWLAASAVLGFASAAGLAVYHRRKRLLWLGFPLTVVWALVLWFVVGPMLR